MLDRFNTFMEGNRTGTPHWADWFPVQERILKGAATDGRSLIVDIAGGRGHELQGFKQRFPHAPGELVLEDLPVVIDDIYSLDEEITRLKHDFFKPQPVHGSFVMFVWKSQPATDQGSRRSRLLHEAYHA